MTTFTVANNAQLTNALASMGGGDTIVLKDGHYGSIRVTADYASTVTIRAEHQQDATIGTLQVWGGSNMRFDGIQFASGMNGSSGRGVVSIENAQPEHRDRQLRGDRQRGPRLCRAQRRLRPQLLAASPSRTTTSTMPTMGVVIYGGPGANVSGNTIDYVGSDVMKFSGLSNATISGNKSYGHIYQSAAAHPDFMQFEGNSSNVRITDNLFLASTIGNAQGIFFSDGSSMASTFQTI